MRKFLHHIKAIALVALLMTSLGAKGDSWALVRLSVANMRANPAHASELVSQAVMGTPVKVLKDTLEWVKVETPEGYRGYIHRSSLSRKTPSEMAAWVKAPRMVMTALDQTNITTTPGSVSPRERVTDLVNGCIVELVDASTAADGYRRVKLPDGRTGYVKGAELTPFDQWASKEWDAQAMLDYAYAMMGTPYLWGGTSSKALDCSGLSKTSYYTQGIILMRDASQQARCGRRIEASDWRTLRPGDLLYFGNPKTRKVTHVAIYDRDGWYVHSSGRVRRNSIDPASPDNIAGDTFLWATRMIDSVGTPGITKVSRHPWYTDPGTF